MMSSQYDINNITIPAPRRLTFIHCKDDCQFCENPTGPVVCHFISLNDNFGFLSCNSCSLIADKVTANWIERYAYGVAKPLLGRKLMVRRSSGTIENDWFLDPDSKLVLEINGAACVSCMKSDKQICKYIRITELFELNP